MNDYGVKIPGAIQKQVDQANTLMTAQPISEGAEIIVDNAPANDKQVKTDNIATTPAPTDNALQQQYNELQSRYNTELPRLSQENNQLRGMVQTLQQNQQALQTIVDTLSKGKTEEPKIEPEIPESESGNISPDDFEGYGPEMVELVGVTNALKKALAESGAEIKRLREEQGETVRQVENVVETNSNSRKEAYFESLDKAVSGWETINSDQRFYDWLKQPDGYSGRIRNDAIREASTALNAPTVIKMFQDFVQQTGYKKPDSSNAYDINATITPDTSGGGGNIGGAGGQKRITAQEVDAAGKDFTRGEIDEVAFNKISNAYMLQLKSG